VAAGEAFSGRFPFQAFYGMTIQRKEVLFYKGAQTIMFSEPLTEYLKTREDIQFERVSTACRRSYYGTWIVEDEKLYLTELEAFIKGYKKVGLAYVFPGQERVFAEWFTGELKIPTGKLLDHRHFHYYERNIVLTFQNGFLTEEGEEDNVGAYIKQQVRLREMRQEYEIREMVTAAGIYMPVKWLNLPDRDPVPPAASQKHLQKKKTLWEWLFKK
jgi:hypothetical protein